MTRLYKNGGRIGKTVDYGDSSAVTVLTGAAYGPGAAIYIATPSDPNYASEQYKLIDYGLEFVGENIRSTDGVGKTIRKLANVGYSSGTYYNKSMVGMTGGNDLVIPGDGSQIDLGPFSFTAVGLVVTQLPAVNGVGSKNNSGIWNLDSAVPAPPALPDYTAFSTYSIGNINEGTTANLSIPIPNAPPSGTSVLVSVSGYTDSGVSASQNGEPAVFNSSGELQFSFTFSADSTTEGNQTLTFTLAATDSLGNPTGSATNTTGTLLDTSKTVAFEITSVSDSTPNEGTNVTFNYRVSNSTQTLYWTTTASSADVSPTSGSSSYSSTTTSGNDTWYNHSVTLSIAADSLSEGNEQFTFNLRSGSTSGTIQDSVDYTIQDTSRGILYGVYATSDTTPDEGTTPYVDFYVTNSSSTMYWSIDSGTSDFSTGSGSVNYYTTQVGYPTANGYDTAYIYRVSVSVTADNTTEGNENHTIRFRSGSTSGTIQASQTLTVQDTSQDPPPPAGGGSTLSGVLLTRSGQYSTTSWENNISIDLSSYVGSTGRLVFYYESDTSFRGDLQLDNINLNGTTYTFASSNDGFETTSVDTNSAGSETTAHYESLSFSSVPTSTNGYTWNRDAGGTPSSSTGLAVDASGSSTGYYLYPETSITHPASYWLRSPEVTLTTGTCSISCARYGSNIGTLKVYWYGSSPAQEVKWYEQFSGNTYRSSYEPAFISWLEALESATNVTELRAFFGSSTTPTYVITDQTYITGLQAAIASGSNYGSGTSSSWFLGWGCGQPGTVSSFVRGTSDNPSFHFGQASACTCDSQPIIRPLIGNQNWGGVGGGCNQGTQYMGMSFITS